MIDDFVFVRKRDLEGLATDIPQEATLIQTGISLASKLPTLDLKEIMEGLRKEPVSELKGEDGAECEIYNQALDDLLKKLGGKE